MTPEQGSLVSVAALEQAAIWVVRLSAGKANVFDAALTRALREVFLAAKTQASLKAIVLSSAGPNFSFGASIAEHQQDQVAAMLATFHSLFAAMADCAVPMLAAVHGHCLGGGLEVASFCHRVFAANNAKLAQPEIVLGVFAPVASLWLPQRVGQSAAEDLCLTGRTIQSEQALQIGLVDGLAEDPEAFAIDYAKSCLLQHSASSLRHATRALRRATYQRFFTELAHLEASYLSELMATHDGGEGIAAFLDKRKPQWSNA